MNLKNYYKWYWNPKIKFKIREYTYRREMALKMYDSNTMLRMLKVHTVQNLDIYLKPKVINWYENGWNVYYSLAKYETGIPHQSIDVRKRDHTWWNQNHHKFMIEFDLLIDIDAPDHSDIKYAKRTALNIVERFDGKKIPHEIRFSGCGFHIIIPYRYFYTWEYSFDPYSDNNIYRNYNLIVSELKERYSEMIDVINDPRRVIKIPYSLALYPNYIFVCIPLTKEKLNNFELDDAKPEKVLAWLND